MRFVFTPTWFLGKDVLIEAFSFIVLFIFTLPQNFRLAFIGFALIGIVFYNSWSVQYKHKKDYRTPLSRLKSELTTEDLVITDDVLDFFDARYYLRFSKTPVKLYNPQRKYIPRYVGTAIIDEKDIIYTLPRFKQVYLLTLDGQIQKIDKQASD